MSGAFWIFGRFLAQTQSSGLGEFLQQISSLLIGTCIAGAIWVVLMVLVAQRARERRRRERLGLAPLPGFWVTLTQRARALLAPASDANADEVPAPDVSALAGGLPEPDLGALLGEDVPAPKPPTEKASSAQPPRVEAEPARTVSAAPLAPQVVELPDAVEHNTSALPDEETPMSQEPPREQDAVEVLRVFRDISDGTLIVEINGRRFTSLMALRTAALERRFLRVLEEMQRFSEPPRLTPRPAPSAEEIGGAPTESPLGDEEPPSLALGSMFRQMRRAAMGQAPAPTEPTPQLSIAEAIEALLQDKLAALPAFRERTIHVTAAPSGGVRIQVDERFYEGVDEVQDEDVRLLLQEVVSEWQKRL